MSSHRRVLLIGGQRHAMEITVDVDARRVAFVKTPKEHLAFLAGEYAPQPCRVEYEEEVYHIRRVGEDTYIAVLEELL